MAAATDTVVKRSVSFLFGMSTLILGANIVWLAYPTILLPTLVEKVVTANKALVVGLLGFVGTLVGILASLLWGIISDHTRSHWGKRSPAILTGSLLALPLIALPVLFLTPSLKPLFFPIAMPIIIISFLGMQFSSNMSNGAWWPLLVDIVPENQRGLASGIQGFLTLMGSVIGVLLITSLNQNSYTASALWLIGGVFALMGVVNVWAIRGVDQPSESLEPVRIRQAFADIFKVRTRINVFFWMVVALLLANMGINGLQYFAYYFFQVYFPDLSPDWAFRIFGGVSLLLTICSAVGLGMLSDKIGRRSMILWSMVICAVTTLMMGFAARFEVFLVLAAVRAIAMGPILSTAPALAGDLSPKDEAGHYMAYNNLSTGLSGGISALIFGLLLVNLTRTTFTYVFIIMAIFFLAGGLIFSNKVSQKELEAGFEAVETAGESG
jgi:MFS family permease